MNDSMLILGNLKEIVAFRKKVWLSQEETKPEQITKEQRDWRVIEMKGQEQMASQLKSSNH